MMNFLLRPTKRTLYWLNGSGIAANAFLVVVNARAGGWLWAWVPFQIAAVVFCSYAAWQVYRAPADFYYPEKEEKNG